MRNNRTTATEPLRTGELVDILTQQILGVIKREGAGPFETVTQPEPVVAERSVKKRSSKKKK